METGLTLLSQVISPNVVEVWEGAVTFFGFPVLVYLAYLIDIGFFSKVSISVKVRGRARGSASGRARASARAWGTARGGGREGSE